MRLTTVKYLNVYVIDKNSKLKRSLYKTQTDRKFN